VEKVMMTEGNDCLRACVATITGISVSKIPNIAHLGIDWMPTIAVFLKSQGWGFILISGEQFNNGVVAGMYGYPVIVTGHSRHQHGNHAVVGLWVTNNEDKTHEIEYYHDPQPLTKDSHPFRDDEIVDIIVLFPITLPEEES
jgi:hypothetical protein